MNEPPTPTGTGSINFHLHALASSLFKGATRYYLKHFGVGLPEMRVLSNLDREGPLAAHQLVTLTAMDKALVSRVLASLVRRNCIVCSSPGADVRRRTWALSRSGRDLVRRLRPVWKAREARIQANLSAAEQAHLVDMLRRLFASSEALRLQEAEAPAAGGAKAPTSAPAPAGRRAPARKPEQTKTA